MEPFQVVFPHSEGGSKGMSLGMLVAKGCGAELPREDAS